MPEPITIIGVGGGILGLGTHLARRYFDLAKEVLDVILGSILFLAFLPLMALCAILIKVCSPGPLLFKQVRVGRYGKSFTMIKFRTMHVDAEKQSGATWAQKNDPRVIPACRWMRRSHVDELPQLIHVIRGEMSLIGPRPERPEILAELEKHYPNVRERLNVKPGITGLAQVRAGYDTSIEAFRHKLDSDLEYISSRRWSNEIKILLKTVGKFHDTTAH